MYKLILLAFLAWQNAAAKDVIYCTHIQVCLLGMEVADSLSIRERLTFKTIDSKEKDFHHFEPKLNEVKALLKADLLLSPPINLNNWVKPIIKKRQKQKKYSLVPLLPQKKGTSVFSKEARAHFWLDPIEFCRIKSWLMSSFSNHFMVKKKHSDCSFPNEEKFLKIGKDLTLVLTHDALAPYLSSNGIKYVSLQGSGAHHSVSSSALKKLSKALKERNSNHLIIVEEGIHIPKKVRRLINSFPKNQILHWKNSGGQDSAFPLKTLFKKIIRRKV